MWSALLLNAVELVSTVMLVLLVLDLHYIGLELNGSECMQSKMQVAPDSPMQRALITLFSIRLSSQDQILDRQ